MPDDHNPSMTNTTFGGRSAARDPNEVRPRSRLLRAGADAETDFEIVHVSEGVDRVRQITTV